MSQPPTIPPIGTAPHLQWPDGVPDKVTVIGHGLDPAAAIAAALAEWSEHLDEDDDTPRLTVWCERWYRWVDADTAVETGAVDVWDADGYLWFWLECNATDPGAVAVTVVVDADELERQRAVRAAVVATEEAIRASVLAAFPMAEIVSVIYRSCRFRLPGLEGDVRVHADDEPGDVWVENRDREAFNRLYRGGAQ